MFRNIIRKDSKILLIWLLQVWGLSLMIYNTFHLQETLKSSNNSKNQIIKYLNNSNKKYYKK